MPKIHTFKHKVIKDTTKPVEETPTNGLIGAIKTGKVDSDNSIKLTGGSVLLSNNARVSSNLINQRMKNRNRETLVRTIF